MDHICVCVCTYKRQKYLDHLLRHLCDLDTGGLFAYSIVITDNDNGRSAESTVREHKEKAPVDILYLVEPEKNISLARNKSVRNASGNFIAMIDDDEFPGRDWLARLYNAITGHDADAVLGPVLPHYEKDPPEWILKGRFCERKRYKTGDVLKNDFRTGNALVRKRIFDDRDNYFDAKYGRTGGEDRDFFLKIVNKGHVVIWCDEAPVHEFVPSERLNRMYYIKRYARIGGISGGNARRMEKTVDKAILFLKNDVALILYAFILFPGLFLGQHVFLKYAIKTVHNIGWFFGFMGYMIVKNKNE